MSENKVTLSEAVEFLKKILPDSYTCEPRKDGVHCYSYEGIKDTFSKEEVDRGENDHWNIIYEAIKQKFGDQFMEVFDITSARHQNFTVYIRFQPSLP